MNRRSGTGVTRGASRAGSWLAGALLALGAVIMAPGGVSAAMAADVAPGDAVFIGSKEGYDGTGIYPIWSSGVQEGSRTTGRTASSTTSRPGPDCSARPATSTATSARTASQIRP